MSNPWLPWLLKQLSENHIIKHWHYESQLLEAAKELEKLQRIEKIINTASKEDVIAILNENDSPNLAP